MLEDDLAVAAGGSPRDDQSERVYGAPSDTLTEMPREFAQPGVPVALAPIREVGFTRTDAR